MRDDIENFISQVVLSTTYNIYTGGNVESPTGYFGTMTFEPNESDVDGIIIPEELRGQSVIATENSNGIISYDTLAESDAEFWFVAQELRYDNWN